MERFVHKPGRERSGNIGCKMCEVGLIRSLGVRGPGISGCMHGIGTDDIWETGGQRL